MKRRISLPILLGGLLVLAGLGLALVSAAQARIGGQKCQAVVSQMQEILPARTSGMPGTYPDAAMPMLEIDGVEYVALLQIPSFGLSLPVEAGWDEKNLSTSPCRFTGSAYDHTLVIGGRDDPQQFGFCGQISYGALVTVTDMTGAEFTYQVSSVERASQGATQWLTNEAFDLTLFCHDLYSMEYIAVRCEFASQ